MQLAKKEYLFILYFNIFICFSAIKLMQRILYRVHDAKLSGMVASGEPSGDPANGTVT
jgi:hypothetical protein